MILLSVKKMNKSFVSISILIILGFCNNIFADHVLTSIEEETDTGLYTIEGRVFPLSDYQSSQSNWQANTRIHVNGGEYIGFVRKSGSFMVHNVPSGSYILEVLNPEYTFESIRVEINSKGKFRARKVNHIQTSLVNQVPYPLKVKALGKTRYFQLREQWRITDFLFNPMVMMMVLPVLLIMVLPKLINDPEAKKEMEQLQNMTKLDIPEVSEMFSNYFNGNPPAQTQNCNTGPPANKKALKAKKRQ